MSDHSDLEELVGDVEDFEGDVDISEWTTLGETQETESVEDKPSFSTQSPSVQHQRGSESPNGSVRPKDFAPPQRSNSSTNKNTSHNVTNDKDKSKSKRRKTETSLGPSEKQIKREIETGDIGDIAGVLDQMDSNAAFEKRTAPKPTLNECEGTSEPNTTDKTSGQSSQNESDILMVIDGESEVLESEEFVEDKDVKISGDLESKISFPVADDSKCESMKRETDVNVKEKLEDKLDTSQKTQKETHKDEMKTKQKSHEHKSNEKQALLRTLSEDEMRSIDSELVEEMMERVRKQAMPITKGDIFTVRFSPVELADLADSTVQNLINARQLNLSFYFKRQGKFKKKKGCAEAYFSNFTEVQYFFRKLLEIKLVERHVEVTVTISYSKPNKKEDTLSFVIWLNRNNKLLKLLKSNEDPTKMIPGASKESFLIEKVPYTSTITASLKTLFPFATHVSVPQKRDGSEKESGFVGPVSVYYANDRWLEAVLDCCADFNFNGCQLSVNYTRKEKESLPKSYSRAKSDSKVEPGTHPNRRSSVQDRDRHDSTASQEGATRSIKDRENSTESQRSDTTPVHSTTSDADDDIANMTLDVCSGMLESLKKLKELGTDNENVAKIMDMQAQLASLQQTLGKASKENQQSAGDPWQIDFTDVSSSSKDSEGVKSFKKMSKEEKRIHEEKMKAERQKKNMEELEGIIEEADEAERQREERLKQQLEAERQQQKEREERNKSSWARKMIEDAKSGEYATGDSDSRKLEAQKFLKAREERLQEEKEMQERERKYLEEKEAKRKEEEEQKRKMKEEEQRRLKEEQMRKAIEEAKKRDEERIRAKEAGRLRLMTGLGLPSRPEVKDKVGEDPLKVQQLGTQSFQDTFFGSLDPSVLQEAFVKKEEGTISVDSLKKKDGNDDGLDDRLAAFEQELAEKGVVTSADKSKSHGMAISPNRTIHNGAPVYSEQEYNQMSQKGQHTLPWQFFIQVTYYANRQCPVEGCPTTKFFKSEESFIDHWNIFHEPRVTMRFCHKCSAYYMNESELENHLIKKHGISDNNLVAQMLKEARVKVVTNPSFRDPGKYLAPLT